MVTLTIRDRSGLSPVAVMTTTERAAEEYVTDWLRSGALGDLRVEVVPVCCRRGAAEPPEMHAVLGCAP